MQDKRTLDMSAEHDKFIRQLKIVLFSTLGPFVLAVVGLMISDHFNIKTNRHRIEIVEKSLNGYVTNDMMVIYIEELRKENNLQWQYINSGDLNRKEEVERINDRIDDLLMEMKPHTFRGGDSIK